MLLRCERCQAEYIVPRQFKSEGYRCKKCYFEDNRTEISRLGIHPALAKKFDNNYKNLGRTKWPNKDPKLSNFPDSGNLPKIPGFELLYQVGKGAMGSVFKARQANTGRMVAIKVLSKDLSLRSDLVARFEREAYALKALAQENVVSIIDAGRIEDTHYFAMEFIEGLTLRARMVRGGISFREALLIAEKILLGLKAAHDLGIIHRDLKPENVLLSYDSPDLSKPPLRVVLVDFGLVGIDGFVFDPHPNLTKSKVTMGTLNYMAPEQHVDAKRVDQRSDIYSAGVILFEMLTGELPLGRYLLPKERGMGLPEKIDEILIKALARSFDIRYENTEIFLNDLALLNNEILSNNNKTENLPFKEKSYFFKSGIFKLIRYPLMALVSLIFFGLGITAAFSKNNTVPKNEKIARP